LKRQQFFLQNFNPYFLDVLDVNHFGGDQFGIIENIDANLMVIVQFEDFTEIFVEHAG
jgi:hypothetical protein